MPQQAWIRNDTFEGNITFGEMTNDSMYEQIVQACALEPDLKILSAGNRTEIGENVRCSCFQEI